MRFQKFVGKNFNVGKDELTQNGLKIKRIATRYSNEEPNTILEQRPRAGTVAKTGLMISVIVSEENPDGNEEPVDIKDDEEGTDDIEALPELKTTKSKKKSSGKSKSKTRDVIKKDKKKKSKDDKKDKAKTETKKTDKADDGKDKKKPNPKDVKPKTLDKPKDVKPAKPKKEKTKPKTGGDTRSRKVPPSN